MIRFPPGGEAHAHDVEWNPRVHFFLDLAPEETPTQLRKVTAAKECWLYIFDQYGFQVAEVFADNKGIYHGVDYGKYAGKDLRPYAESGDGVSADLPLFAGQKSLKALPAGAKPGDNLLKYFYWILPSPFQLPWSRFPHVTSQGMKNTFQTWATSKRGLSATFAELDEKTGDPLKTLAIRCPWLHVSALNACFRKAQDEWLTKYLQNQERIRLRTLCSYVRTVEAVVGKARFDKVVDDLIIQEQFLDEERTLKEQVTEPARVTNAREALLAYLKGPSMVAIKEDAVASADPRAIGGYSEIKALGLEGLDGVGGDGKYLQQSLKDDESVLTLDLSVYEEKVKKFLVDSKELVKCELPHWKEARKIAKSYWYLVKAYAQLLSWKDAGRLTNDLKWAGRSLFGVLVDYGIPKAPPGPIRSARLYVTVESALKKKLINNPHWNGFFVALDGLNFVMALKDRAEGKGSTSTVTSAAGSFLNTSLSAVEADMARDKIERLFFTEKTLAEDAAKLAAKESSSTGGKGVGTMLRKFNTPKSIGLVGKLSGAAGAAFETWNSIEKAKKAGAAFDSEAAAAHWVCAGASAATFVGYVMGGVSTFAIIAGATAGWPLALGAIGALLIFGGSATDLGIKLTLPVYEHDPLENWLRVSPWGRELKHRLPTFEKQSDAFYRALVGLRVTYRYSLASFDLTIETREVEAPGRIFLDMKWATEASTRPYVYAMAPLTEAHRIGPTTFRYKEFSTEPKWLTARVRLQFDDGFYPTAGPQVFNFPE
jgi:hypothetical protein